MKYSLLLALLFIPVLAKADIVTDCGEYSLKGVVRGGVGISIVVNEKTMSQYTITMPVDLQGQIGAYLDAAISAKIVLQKKLTPVKGLANKIVSIERRVPDPLNPEDTGLTLTKKKDCEKI
ncbi:MAG: hypothetical protein H7177_14010 [Rhizobacter sp.]|nr:hypothetical protein [Bacteriovorax sp.]